MKISHRTQTTNYSCAAVCFSMLTGVSEGAAMQACRTRKTGTSVANAVRALNASGFPAHLIPLQDDFFALKERIQALSYHFPIVLSGTYKNRYFKAGRDRKGEHAVVAAGGLVYDPSLPHPVDIDAYHMSFNKSLTIKFMVVIDKELDGYGQN